MSHFFISAAHKSSGKTTLSIGLCAALRERGLAVQSYKKGPDYIDPLWLTLASGRPCLNLDFFTMRREEILSQFSRLLKLADIGLIEGNKGLYDGLDLDGSNSNAALAALLDAPVILVIDACGMTRGIAPLILGYQAFDKNIRIAGVILNKVGGSRHESKLRRVIEHYTDVPVIGSVHRARELELVERHLGLMPSNEAPEAEAKILAMGNSVAAQVDLATIVDISHSARVQVDVRIDAAAGKASVPVDVRIGFYYPGDLEALANAGAELVAFNTLTDASLPAVDGLFIGGGFPEAVMAELEANAAMRAAVKAFVESGGPVYAECGGLMYLARSLTWKDRTCDMVGVIAGDVRMHERPQGRGYVRLKETPHHRWPRLPDTGEEPVIAAHEFHYSALDNLDVEPTYAFEVLRGTGIDGDHDGLIYKNMLAGYTHMRAAGGNQWPQRFVAHVRACKQESKITSPE